MAQMKRTGRVVFHDASLAIWEEGLGSMRTHAERDAWERAFRDQVFKRVIQQLNRLGWKCTAPAISEHDVKHYGSKVARLASERKRICLKGDLQGELEISGRTIKFEMWQSVNTPTRPDHGGRYEHNKEKVMPYVLRLEMERTRRRIRDYLCNIFDGYEFDAGNPGLGELTAAEYAAQQRKSSGHYVPELDHARINMACNARSRDGNTIQHGAKVWALDRKDRIITGTAYYSLNASWQIVSGRYGYTVCQASEIFTQQPENLRVKRNGKARRNRLECELNAAVKVMDFDRAKVIKNILFPPDEEL